VKIAIFNGVADILAIVRDHLTGEGFNVVTGTISDFKKGAVDFVEFMEKHKPDVVVYDIPPPYDQNAKFLRLILDTHSMDKSHLIITTTNKSQLEQVTGEKDAIEIVGKPYDLELLTRSIREKIHSKT